MRAALQHIPPMLLILLLTSLPHLIYVLSNWYAVPLRAGELLGPTDPDPWLRLTLVREWLTNGDWYSHAVPHSNAPLANVISPWTRPLDMVIAALAQLQPASVDISLRLMRAALLLPWVWMTLLVLGIYRIVRLANIPPSAYLMASFLVAATPTLWNYFGLGNADHHAPLTVAFIWAMASVLNEKPTRQATIISGVLFGIQLWMSVEALILIAAVYGWYGLQWLSGKRAQASPLRWLATSTAITAAAALIIERPLAAWLTPIYDTISIVHVVALMIAAIVAWLLHISYAAPQAKRFALAALYSFAALATLYATYPLLFSGPMVEADPYMRQHFLARITEVKPFYDVAIAVLLANSILPIAAILLCVAAWRWPARAFYSRPSAGPRLFFITLTLALYYSQQRWSYYLLPLAIAVVAPVLGALLTPTHKLVRKKWPARAIAHLPENLQARRRLPVLLLLAGLPAALFIIANKTAPVTLHNGYQQLRGMTKPLSSAERKAQDKSRNACYADARRLMRSGELTRTLGKRPLTLLAPTDLGAEILFFTPYRIVASNYHREGKGIQYVMDAYTMADTERLRAHLAKRSVDAVLVCPPVDAAKGSALQRLQSEQTMPDWLETAPYKRPQLPADSKDDADTAAPLLLKVRYTN